MLRINQKFPPLTQSMEVECPVGNVVGSVEQVSPISYSLYDAVSEYFSVFSLTIFYSF